MVCLFLVGTLVVQLLIFLFVKRRIEHFSRELEGFENANLEQKQFILLRECYVQGLAQSSASFWFSIISGVIGFMIIIAAIVAPETVMQSPVSYILFAGFIVDAVSVLFFVHSNKARQLMIEFFEKFQSERRIKESLKLVEKISDEKSKQEAQMLLALKLAGINVNDRASLPAARIDINTGSPESEPDDSQNK
jgi:hypothetical protein